MLTTSSFLPQAMKVIRTRDTRAISLWMYILFTAGVFFWLVFGIIIMSWPVIAANAVTFILTSTILTLKLREKRVSATGTCER